MMADETTGSADMAENAEAPQDTGASVANTEAANSTPDLTPSRRSSRKKQSTFSSDFEYYTPTGRKKELKDDELRPSLTNQVKPAGKGKKKGKQPSNDEGQEGEGEEDEDEGGKRKPMKRKVAVRKQQGAADAEAEDESEKDSVKPKAGKGKLKVAVKKKKAKGAAVAKRKTKESEEMEEGSEEEEESSGEESVASSTAKGQKRKKNPVKAGNKRAKADKKDEEEEEEESSDEEESTPISQLKAQMKQQKPVEKPVTVSSPLAQNLVKKLMEASTDTGSSPEKIPVAGQKRKLVSGSEDDEEVPLKKLQTPKLVQIEKLAPALAGLVKRLPPSDLGLVKRSPSEIAAKTSATQKKVPSDSTVSKATEKSDSQESLNTNSEPKPVSKVEEVSQTHKRPVENEKKAKVSTLKMPGVKDVKKPEGGSTTGGKTKAVGKAVKVESGIKKLSKDGQIIKNSDNAEWKKKISDLKGKVMQREGIKVKAGAVKGGEKLLSGVAKQKLLLSKQKLQTSELKSKSLSKKADEKSVSILKQKKVGHIHSKGDGVKVQEGMTKIGQGDGQKIKKPSLPIKNVDDLLKRGIVHKKKSHQPFGNKKTVTKIVGKDLKTEVNKDVKPEELKKKPGVQKSEEKGEIKKPKDRERKKSSEALKHGRDRSLSSDSGKGERRKSSEGGKKSEKSSKVEDEDKKPSTEDGPPPLLPVSATAAKHRHKHPKPEHEVPMDMTMMDLFKPDGLIVHDQQKKEEAGSDGKPVGSEDRKSQYTSEAYDPESYVKPENAHHVLIEHQYSKPSSPVTPKQETQKNVGTSAGTGRNDDIESVSHKQTVIMDMNLPDQILEESEEPVVEESADGLEETWPDNMEELQQRVSKASSGDRSSILESLDTELKESGTEFRIVGQVEVGRASLGSPEENVFTSLMSSISSQIPKDTKEEDKKKKDGEKSVSVRKVSTEARKSSTEKRRDSGEKRKDSTEKRTDKQSSSSEKSKGSTVKSKHHKTSKTDGKGGGGPGGKEEDDESDEHPFEDDENDEDWEPNDSDALYCLCKKPHNNRFMICCDKCEEWFHGTCVGITRARGKEMEDNEEEYICPVCAKQGGSTSAEKPGSPAVSKTTESPSPAKPKLQQKCIGRKCNKTPRPGSVYCSNECIMSHAQESLKAIREEQIRKKAKEKHHSSSPSTKSQSQAPSGETVEVVERQSGKVLKGSSAPTPKGLHQWLEQHPTFEVVQPHKHRSSSSTDRHRDKDSKSDRHSKSTSEAGRKMSSDSDRDRKSDRDDKSRHGHRSRHSSTGSKDSGQRSDSGGHRSSTSQRSESTSSNSSKADEKKEDGPNQIRINVRSALRDSLTARAHDADDIMLSSTEIKSLAVTIEEELFSLFSDTGHKYRTKYRSLIFNIKDQKNKGLFRKILTGKIKPHKLVQMSTEELASRELAKWREQESKHQLEMIEKTEQEALKESESAKHVRKKTHKGEVEVEDEDLSILESRVEERKDPEPEPQEEQANAPVIDTTDQHRAHLFDLNCKVCTGKIVPGPEEQAAAAAAHKMKVAHLQSYEEEREEEETSGEKEDFEKAEEIVKEALRHVQKTEKEVSSLPKIVSSSPAPEEPPPPLSPKAPTPRRESTSSTSSASSIPSKKKVVVRSPDSALQSGLEAKPKFTPTGPVLWKGFVSMLDVAKFFTSAYKVSGPTDHITIPDTVHIMGRISPDHMWDYLSKIRQAGSKDLTVIRFIPGSDDEKVAYVHLYSYLNSRGRCGVAGNPNKQIKDFYIVPLASHSRIPRTLLPFDGPGLEENRPHMLIGILVRQRGKHGSDTSDTGSTGSGKSSSQSNSTTKKSGTQPVSRDPRLAKLAAAAAKEASPAVSPPESSSSSTSSTGDVKPKTEEYEPEYVPMPVKAKTAHKPVVEYIPTPTVKKKDKSKETAEIKTEQKTPTSDDSSSSKDSKEKHHHHHKDHHHHHHDHHHPHHHHHHHHHKKEKPDEMEDDSEPYSPGKEAEPYSPGQEAAADEPYDPGDESLMDEDGIPVMSTNTSTPAASSVTPLAEAVVATMTATSTAPTVSALSSSVTAAAEQSALLNISATQKETSNSIAELVERMARSNDPQEISSLMVTALSTANSPQEQQKLLVDLTKQVEDRKLQLAEAARKESTGLGSGGLKLDEKQKSGESGGGLLGMSSTEKSLASVVGGEVVRGLVAAGIAASVPASSAAVTATVSAGVDNTAISTGAPGGVLSSSSSSATKSEQDQTVSSSSASSTVSSSLSTTALSNVWFSGMSSSKNSDTTNSSVSDIPIPPSSSSSSSSSTLPMSAAPDTSTSGASTSGSKDSGVIKFSFTKTLAKPSQILSSQTANVFSTETMDTKPLPRLDDDSTQQTSKLDTNDSSSVKSGDTASSQPGAAGSSTEIPDALKALMNDVMGNTQFSSLERRRKMLMKKEAEKAERAAKEAAKEEQDAKERLSAEEQNAEAQKRLDDEMEARRILDSIKKTESSGGTSSTSTVTPAGDGGEPKGEPAEAKPTSAPTAAPSIDELLDRLKKGGFQFPIQKTESTSSVTTTSTATTTVSGTSSSSSTTPSLSAADSSPFSTTAASSSSVLPSVAAGSSTGPVPSTTSVESNMDVDLRQIKSPAAASIPSTAAATNVASTGSTDSKPTRFGDFDSQAHSNLQDRDERSFCQDRDERLYRPLPPSLPKHPLDPHAFPPLPVDPRGYPSVPHPPPPLPPPPHGPLHPRFPLPSADPHVSYHPTPRASLGPRPLLSKGRAQPPPPGTEFDKPAGVLGITNDFPPSDVDMRSRNRPPLPPDQPPPPLPPQPPPPLPPLPGNRGPPGGHYPHPPPGDMDFRTGDPYGPRPPPHHSDYQGHHGYPGHGRGGGRPYHRH